MRRPLAPSPLVSYHPRMFKKLIALIAFAVAVAVVAPQAQTKTPKLTTPKEQFGHDIGDDYFLVNYTQYVDYLQKLDKESDRMTVVEIGKTEEGRPELTAIITSPENHRKLAQYKEMNRKLALADGITDDQARQLAKDSKAVVWIDGGLHATEVLGAQQLIETIYRLNAKTDSETQRILNDDIILCTLVNPDGMELVSNWYMREGDEKKRSTNGIPRLYQKYIGHDDNRDFYMMNMSESTNANRVMYREWYPAIMYNHHQTGPAGAVLFAPPFRDPFNYNFDPLVVLGIDTVGSAIHTRLAAEGKPGAVMRSGAPYSTWFNGGIRTTSYFHNQIGILTETIGNPTPVEIPFVLDMQLPRADVPNPIAPQTWHFRQSIEYSVTNNYAILDIASKRKEDFLFNMYKMAKNAIEKGSRDNWTIHPQRIEAAREAIEAREAGTSRGGENVGPRAALGGRGVAATGTGQGGGRGAGAPVAVYNSVLHDPKLRDPRGFILPADQPDFLTATKFMNILIKAGVTVHRATAPFTVNGKQYPAGSYVVNAAQPFRAHVRCVHHRRARQRRVRGRESAAQSKAVGVASGGAVQRERQVVSGRQLPRARNRGIDADSPESGRRQRPRRRWRAERTNRRASAVCRQAGTHRPVGSVRRFDAVGMDALVVRAVRVPVRSRLPAGARRGESELEVRRAGVRRWRHPGA